MILIKNSDSGQVQISDEVISIIAGTAALEIEGISTGETGILGKRNFSKGIKVNIDGNKVQIILNVSVKIGHNIPNITLELQKKVKSAVETMTGLLAENIDVNVIDIVMSK